MLKQTLSFDTKGLLSTSLEGDTVLIRQRIPLKSSNAKLILGQVPRWISARLLGVGGMV